MVERVQRRFLNAIAPYSTIVAFNVPSTLPAHLLLRSVVRSMATFLRQTILKILQLAIL